MSGAVGPALHIAPVTQEDGPALARWLCAQRWPFHLEPQISEDEVLERFAGGYFTRGDVRTFRALDHEGACAAMMRVFEKCGYQREAHHRQAWRLSDGRFADAVGYAVLRTDVGGL